MILADIRPNTIKTGCETMKIVGWNIYLEKEDENGELKMVVWDISKWLAERIDEEFIDTFLIEES